MPLQADLTAYVAALEHRFGADLVSVVAFGSRVRGDAGPESDLDVLVVARRLPRRRWDRYAGLRDLAASVSEEFAIMVSPILLTSEEATEVKPYYLGMLSGHAIVRDEAGSLRRSSNGCGGGSTSWAPGDTSTRTATNTGT